VSPLLSRVKGLRFRFFDGHTWSENWGGDRTKARVPQAVEVELTLALAETSGRQHTEPFASAVFSTLVDLPLAQPSGVEGRRGGSS
jgi:type II secretion system (T2SS) protein J